MKIIKNSIVDRFEIVQDSAVAYFQQISEQLKAKYDTWTIINILGKKIVYRIGKFIPNYEDVIRRFTKQENNILMDKFGNDAPKILPVSTIISTSVAEFTDLSGVAITSYSGDQLLSISGNNIISSGTGFVFDLLLSDGTFIPFLHLKTDVSGNENHILNITDISKEYRLTGSTYLQDKGNVERNPELFSGFSSFGIGWVDNLDYSYTCDGSQISSSVMVASNVVSIASNVIVSYRISNYISGSFRMRQSGGFVGNFNSSNGVFTQIFNSVTASNLVAEANADFIGKIDIVSIKLATPAIIPNTPTGQAAYPIVSGDTFIAGGGMMNLTDCLVRLYEVGDTDPAKLFFNKSDRLIWKTGTGGDWHTSELTQQWIYDNIQDTYKYQLWSKVNSLGIFKDIFLYPISLGIEDAVKAGKYVGSPVVIPYEVTEGNYQVTEGDYLVTP